MNSDTKRLLREKRTFSVMLKMYCNNHHSSELNLCEDCDKILKYALSKIDKCVFGEQKPVCNECQIHCYAKEMRNKVKEIMRYSGPRMIIRHPYLAIMHNIDKRKYKSKIIEKKKLI